MTDAIREVIKQLVRDKSFLHERIQDSINLLEWDTNRIKELELALGLAERKVHRMFSIKELEDMEQENKSLKERIKQLEIQLGEMRPDEWYGEQTQYEWYDWSKDHEPVIGNWIEWNENDIDDNHAKAERTDAKCYSLWYPLSHGFGVRIWRWSEFKNWGQWRYCDSPQQEKNND